MKSFTGIISIYNEAMNFLVTRIGSRPYRFKTEIGAYEPKATILTLLTGNKWNIGHISMKYFTKGNIDRLGLLIENEKPKWSLG